MRTTAGALSFILLNNEMDATSQFNKWETGLTGVIEIQVSKHMNIIASYEHGLTKIDRNNRVDAYNRAYKIGLSMKL